MTELETLIRAYITRNGAMPFETYMAWCLFHPLHGYYVTRDPLGAKGDFTTAPEISQLFGEMCALWAMDAWVKLGKPKDFVLLECGPGRGTLMADLLRTAKAMPDFLKAAHITLIEKSPSLKTRQQAMLRDYQVTWREDAMHIPALPTLMLCNEFFDAFPIKRFAKSGDAWVEQQVIVKNGALDVAPNAAPFREENPATENWLKEFSAHLAAHKGAALIIDYGYDGELNADTLQAMKAHKYVSPLEMPGECDLTAHVDFASIRKTAEAAGLKAAPLLTQRDFLSKLGIDMRLHKLLSGANAEQAAKLASGAARLINAEEMGTLFKAICIHSSAMKTPVPF